MRMKRLISLAFAVVLALTVAGIAIAHGGGGPAEPTKEVTATFTATPVAGKTDARQCVGVDGTYAITREVATGTANGDDDRLDGNITIKSKSVVNTTTFLGWSEGKVFTTDPATGKLKGVAGFTAVVKGDKLEGFVLGKVKNPAAPAAPKAKNGNGEGHGNGNDRNAATLRANVAATVAPDGTITGQLGGGGGANTAIISGNPCSQPQNTSQSQGEGHGNGHPSGDHSGNNGDNGNNGGGRRGNR
jgi:hypothetical protein